MNPALGIPKAMKETPRERILSLTEMRKIYSAACSLSPANKLFIQMLLLTGQRAGVIAKLCRTEWLDDHLEIAGERNKSGERILVPSLCDSAEKAGRSEAIRTDLSLSPQRMA